MSRSRESRPHGSRKQRTKITYAARARTLNRLKKLSWGTGIRSLSSFSLGIGYPGHAQRVSLPSYPQQGGYPTSRSVAIADPPERDCSYHCFACYDAYQWYDPRGKGEKLL